VSQPTLNPARTHLTRGLSELDWIQPTFGKTEFFSTQPDSIVTQVGSQVKTHFAISNLNPSLSLFYF